MRRWRAGGRQVIPRPDGWSVGAAPLWVGSTRQFDVAEVEQAMRTSGGPRRVQASIVGSKSSAVLVAVVDGDHGAEILLTRRSWDLRHHRGEVSFPGGRLDPGESVAEAALREAYEEVDLDPTLVSVIGELDHLSTFVSDSYIVPIVARLDRRPQLVASAAEVDRIFYVPLVELQRADTHREEDWGDHTYIRRLQFFELDDETVWGATARILVNLLDVLFAS